MQLANTNLKNVRIDMLISIWIYFKAWGYFLRKIGFNTKRKTFIIVHNSINVPSKYMKQITVLKGEITNLQSSLDILACSSR